MDGTDGTAIFSKKKVSELQIKSKKSDIPPRGRTLTCLFLKKGPKVSKNLSFERVSFDLSHKFENSKLLDNLRPFFIKGRGGVACLSIILSDQKTGVVRLPVVKEARNKLLFLGLSSPDDLKRYMLSGVEAHTCSICQNFSHKSKYTLQNHIESKHFPNAFLYQCTGCGVAKKTKTALERHMPMCMTRM